MRAFVDRLLFSLPSPSRASLARGAGYLIFGLLLYGLFLGGFMARDMATAGLERWCAGLSAVRVRLSAPRLSFFPPALEADALAVQPRGAASPIALRRVRARLTFFPLGLAVNASVAGGTLQGTAIPSSVWKPERFDIRADLAGAGAEALLQAFGAAGGTLAEVRGGTLDGSASLVLPLQKGLPAPAAGEGELRLALRGAAADLRLPMLAFSRVDALEGDLETEWKKERVSLRRLELRSPLVTCSAQGQITLAPRDLPASRMDMETLLRIPPERLRQELVPERTLQSIKAKGEVCARLRGTFRRPSLDVQP